MNEIEERAEAFAISISPYSQDNGAKFDTDTMIAYINGATEQKQIDIDKACEWLKENIYDYIAVGNTDYGKPYDIELCSEELFDDFKKAMK